MERFSFTPSQLHCKSPTGVSSWSTLVFPVYEITGLRDEITCLLLPILHEAFLIPRPWYTPHHPSTMTSNKVIRSILIYWVTYPPSSTYTRSQLQLAIVALIDRGETQCRSLSYITISCLARDACFYRASMHVLLLCDGQIKRQATNISPWGPVIRILYD